MSIDLRGRGQVSLHEHSWIAAQKIARELGWVPEMEMAPTGGHDWPGYDYKILENNARALAKTLYQALHMIAADSLDEPLVELVKEARVPNLRAIADLAYAGAVYVD